MRRKPGGCRSDQIFGLWAIEETRFAVLAALHAASVGCDALPQTLYALDERMALIAIIRMMAKYPTNLSWHFGGAFIVRTRQALRALARDLEVEGNMVTDDTPRGAVAGTADVAADSRLAASRKPLQGFVHGITSGAGPKGCLSIHRQVRTDANLDGDGTVWAPNGRLPAGRPTRWAERQAAPTRARGRGPERRASKKQLQRVSYTRPSEEPRALLVSR